MKQNIFNYTPHRIDLLNNHNEVVRTFAPTGLIRLKASTVNAGFEIDGVSITTTKFGEPEGLPEAMEGIFYIVSQLVKSALPHRKDLLVPADVVRDSNGNILGCKSLGI